MSNGCGVALAIATDGQKAAPFLHVSTLFGLIARDSRRSGEDAMTDNLPAPVPEGEAVPISPGTARRGLRCGWKAKPSQVAAAYDGGTVTTVPEHKPAA